MTEYEERKQLTFAQAEEVEPLPQQLSLKELSQPLRVRLLKVILESLEGDRQHSDWSDDYVGGRWGEILYDKHVLFDHEFPDEYKNNFDIRKEHIGALIKGGDYVAVLGAVQFFLRHKSAPFGFDKKIDWALRSSNAAYRLYDGNTIVPQSSAAEGEAVRQAFVDLRPSEFNGARRHLAAAGELLTGGEWAGSVRESIHAVEAVARMLDPKSTTLDPALKKLASAGYIHPAMRDGFGKLYGYTSDQQGIRHAHINDDVRVDEIDALYMFGACASFVTYLIGKAHAGGLRSS